MKPSLTSLLVHPGFAFAPLATESARRRAVAAALRPASGPARSLPPDEQHLLERFVRGELTLAQLAAELHQWDADADAYYTG